MFLREEMLEEIAKAYRGMKTFGIILSILLIILGLVMFFLPATATNIAMWLMFVGLLFLGISEIVSFAKMPAGFRNGWMLACGIIWTLIAAFSIIGGLNASVAERLVAWGTFQMVIAFMVGFTSIFNGIQSLCSCGQVKAMGGSTAPFIISGILNVIVGIICLSYPIGAVITLTIFYGLFLLIAGISLLCKVLSF